MLVEGLPMGYSLSHQEVEMQYLSGLSMKQPLG